MKGYSESGHYRPKKVDQHANLGHVGDEENPSIGRQVPVVELAINEDVWLWFPVRPGRVGVDEQLMLPSLLNLSPSPAPTSFSPITSVAQSSRNMRINVQRCLV